MNENINLCEILKDCPEGTELYSAIHGIVYFVEIEREDDGYPIVVDNGKEIFSFTAKGRYEYGYDDGEIMLFPSKDQRDWSKFKPKKPKFAPKTLQPFDRVLVRTEGYNLWSVDLFSFINDKDFKCIGGYFRSCIPYNEETKHLLGTSDEAPEYYRYWED